LQRLPDVLSLQIRIGGQDFSDRHAIGDEIED
jgi:hypothetical protein